MEEFNQGQDIPYQRPNDTEEYVPRIVTPDPAAILRKSLPELNEIMGIKLDESLPHYYKNNKFRAYSLCTSEFSVIQKAYMKVKVNHAEARHIVCAYNIPGLKKYECADGCDDEEYGISSQIVQLLVENDITHRAIFVVRNCGEKLHQERSTQYLLAVRKVISQFPLNECIQRNQYAGPPKATSPSYAAAAAKSSSSQPAKINNKLQNTGPNRGRGRGRGKFFSRGRAIRRPYGARGGRGGGNSIKYSFSEPQNVSSDMDVDSAHHPHRSLHDEQN